MASPPGDPFWMRYARAAMQRYNDRSRILHTLHLYSILHMTGPVMLDDTIAMTPLEKRPNVLPLTQYNPMVTGANTFRASSKKVYARHHGTKSWAGPHRQVVLFVIAVVLISGVLIARSSMRPSIMRR
jgi:hypothetical protein